MTELTLIEIAGLLGFPACFISAFFASSFCVRPAPRGFRNYLVIALGVVMFRLGTRTSLSETLDMDIVGVLYINLAVALWALALFNAHAALVLGDSCAEHYSIDWMCKANGEVSYVRIIQVIIVGFFSVIGILVVAALVVASSQ